MKKNIRSLFVAQVLIILFNQIALSQNPKVSSIFSFDKTENITADELKRLQRNEFQTQGKIEDLYEPTLTQINFDDIILSQNNSIIIAPNRYAGVNFYSPYYNNNTYLTYTFRNSYPNSLFVGYEGVRDPSGSIPIISVDSLVVEFAQPAKDVAFLWGNQNGYYSTGQIQIYNDNNQLVANFASNVSSFWTSISLNQYSQRIKKLF